MTDYRCPRTGRALHAEAHSLRAADGQAEYPTRNGIPCFLRFEPAEDEATRDRLSRLSRLAREGGWQYALSATFGNESSMVRYVTDESRAAFIELLPLTAQSDVLEIGPGLGQFTAALARRSRSVSALEIVDEQAEFASLRCSQQGIDNASFAVGGDDCRLPYPDESFDVVVLNLVFEWCASRCHEEPFEDVQRRLLSEIHRVLRPGGSLYLTTKNRFALRLLLGKRDEHCHDIRFGSALPRWLLRYIMRSRGHGRSAGMLHSHTKLESMLRRAGFGRVASYWATPDMRYPACYVPNDPASIRSARRRPGFVQGDSRSTRLVMRFIPAPLVKFFTPGFAFLATKRAQ